MHGSLPVGGQVGMGGDVAPDRYEKPKGFSLSLRISSTADVSIIICGSLVCEDMSIHAVYRMCIWLPIVVPAVAIAIATFLGLRLADGVLLEILMYSLMYGGLPYAALAIWATWWIGGRPEREIRRLMFRAPILMAALFVPLALVVGFALGALGPFAAVAILGIVIILPLGYAYVGVAVLLRRSLGPPVLATRSGPSC
jgi:hypothetical protein